MTDTSDDRRPPSTDSDQERTVAIGHSGPEASGQPGAIGGAPGERVVPTRVDPLDPYYEPAEARTYVKHRFDLSNLDDEDDEPSVPLRAEEDELTDPVPALPAQDAASKTDGVVGTSDESDRKASDSGAGHSVGRSSAIMALGTLASRVLGQGRQLLLTMTVGSALAAEAFNAANNLPNILYMLLSAGVLNAVLIPQITKAMKRPDGGKEFVDRLLTISLAMVAGLAVLATVLTPLLIHLQTQLGGSALHLAILFGYLLMPEILFYGVYAVLGNVLNARNQFAAFMWAPALANVVQIAGLLGFWWLWRQQPSPTTWSSTMIWVLAGSMTLGIAAQALVLVIPLVRGGFRWRPRWGLRGTGLGETSRMVGWTFTALVIAQLGGIINTRVLTGVAERNPGVSGFTVQSYALTLFYLPHSLITVSILTALFPQMARSWQDHDVAGLRRLIGRALGSCAVGIIPASAAMIALAHPMSRVMFPGFSARATHDAAVALQIMAVGTLAFGISTLQQRYSFAREEGRQNFAYQILLTAVQLAFAGIAWWVSPPRMAVATVALGLVVSNSVVSVAFLMMARRQLGGLDFARVLRLWVRLLLAAVLAGATAWLAVYGMTMFGDRWLMALVTCMVAGICFGLVFLAVSRILHIREVDELLSPVLRRVGLARRS